MSALEQYRITAASASELVRSIEAGVACGELRPGERLPSVRRLAADAGLSPATVSSALAELRRRGVVISERRRGTRIGERVPIGIRRPRAPLPAGARDLSRGNPDPSLLPDLSAALARCPARSALYGERGEDPQLLELARERLDADGVPSGAVCVVSGALDGAERVLQAWLRPGDAVAVEDPGYAELYDLLRADGLHPLPVAVDERGMLPEPLNGALERGARAAVLTPRGQNPTGAALDARRTAALKAVLDRFPDTVVIDDDHLGPLAGAPLHSAAGGRRRWAAARSVAKALGPDLRLAILAGDEQTIARVQGRQRCGPGWVSHVLQSLVRELWLDPRVEALVARATSTYRRRRERLIDCLASRGIEARGASGLNVWIPVPDEAAVIGALLQQGWALAPGAPYRLSSEQAVRVTTSTLDEGEAPRLADDIAAALSPSGWTRSG